MSAHLARSIFNPEHVSADPPSPDLNHMGLWGRTFNIYHVCASTIYQALVNVLCVIFYLILSATL